VWGTAARAVVGVALAGSVLYGHAARGWHPVAWLLGLVVFPAVVLGGQWWWARRRPAPLRATGPVAHAVNLAVFLALYLTWWCQVGCALLGPVDALETAGRTVPATTGGVRREG
jgi:hypothetical protein